MISPKIAAVKSVISKVKKKKKLNTEENLALEELKGDFATMSNFQSWEFIRYTMD